MRQVKKYRDYHESEIALAKKAYAVYAAAMKAQSMTLYDPTWSHLSAEKRVAWIEASNELWEEFREDEGYYANPDNRWPRDQL